jgi:AcrR family transcriptional regulator
LTTGPVPLTIEPEVVLLSPSAPSAHRRLADAAIAEFGEHGLVESLFPRICTRAKVSRATGYRLFPGGIESVVRLLHAETVAEVVRSVGRHTRRLGRDVSFSDAVEAGVQGVAEALRSTPWVRDVLGRDRNLMTSYLLNREPGGILAVLAEYAAACAATFGEGVVANASEAAEQFVWNVFSRLLAELPPSAPGQPWPDPDHLWNEAMQTDVQRFVVEVGLVGSARKAGLAVPRYPIPREIGIGLPLLSLSR